MGRRSRASTPAVCSLARATAKKQPDVFGTPHNAVGLGLAAHLRRRSAASPAPSTAARSADSNAIVWPRPPQTPAASFKRLYREW